MCDFFIVYLKEAFSVGKSAKSLISEVIDIIRTFQKMSAPTTFYYHISKNFQKMFKWASDIIEIICNLCGHPSFSELQQFFIFTFAFPLSICTFISVMLLGTRFYVHFLMVIIALALPVGYYFIEYEFLNVGIGLIVGSIVVTVITIVLICKFGIIDIDTDSISLFSISFLSAFAILIILMIPSLFDKHILGFVLCIFIGIFCALTYIIESIVKCCGSQSDSTGYKAIGLAINIYSLTIIPSTKAFFKLLGDPDCLKWNIITSYVLISIVLPIVFTLTMIFTKHPDIEFRYKNSCYFFFELFEQLKEIAYIFCAEFNEYWGCISLEIIWVISLIIFRPYSAISEYVLEFSTSLMLMISNGLLFHARGNNNEIFGITTQISFFIMSIVPSIISFFCYFIFDFGNKVTEGDIERSLNIMGKVIIYGVPVVWVFAALNTDLIIYLF